MNPAVLDSFALALATSKQQQQSAGASRIITYAAASLAAALG